MINLKCTKKLFSRIRESPEEIASKEPRLLGDWVANIIPIWGGELIIFINERTYLTLVLPISAVSDLQAAFRSQLFDLLRDLKVPKSFIGEVRTEISEISYTKTDSRRMLALLNDATYYYQDVVDFAPPDRIRNQVDMQLHMADWLYGPAPYQRPTVLLLEVVRESAK